MSDTDNDSNDAESKDAATTSTAAVAATPKKRSISIDTKAKIIKLRDAGFSIRQVAKELGVSKGTVQNAYRRKEIINATAQSDQGLKKKRIKKNDTVENILQAKKEQQQQQQQEPEIPTVTVVHCWSAPRSRSTALLYSFEALSNSNNGSCIAIDEPLYREWLMRRSDIVARPYTQAMIHGDPSYLSSSSQDECSEKAKSLDSVVWQRELKSLPQRIYEAAEILLADIKNALNGSSNLCNRVIFCKHMAKHSFMYDFDHEVELRTCKLVHKHLLLVRDPVAVLSSWHDSDAVHGQSVAPDEVGIVPLLSIYTSVCGSRQPKTKHNKKHSDLVVLDSDELVQEPAVVLKDTCEKLGIMYSDSMMTWSSGPHDCDGPWAPWWYDNAHKSTGWSKHVSTVVVAAAAAAVTATTAITNGNSNGSNNGSSAKTNHYRTLDPRLLPALKASYPAYQFLSTLTRGYRLRGPEPVKLYEDPRNEHLLVYVGARGGRGRLVPREMAGLSPWDSSVQGGDATWEGLRVYNGKILSLNQHLRRLFKSAKALGFENMHTKEEITDAIFRTLAANGMRDGAHIRLTLTRGEKYTSSMNPNFNVYGTTLIVLAEWKPTEGVTTYDNSKGIVLITASQRRNSPQTCDSKIHHNNLINNILPKIQANVAGAADAIMLDLEGYVSETNATNIFMVDNGVLLTPHADHCLPGITRATVLEIAKELDIPTEVRRISLAEFHSADEVFTTGTMGGLTPVRMIDGRLIGVDGTRGPITTRLQELYKTLPDRPGWATELPHFEAVSSGKPEQDKSVKKSQANSNTNSKKRKTL